VFENSVRARVCLCVLVCVTSQQVKLVSVAFSQGGGGHSGVTSQSRHSKLAVISIRDAGSTYLLCSFTVFHFNPLCPWWEVANPRTTLPFFSHSSMVRTVVAIWFILLPLVICSPLCISTLSGTCSWWSALFFGRSYMFSSKIYVYRLEVHVWLCMMGFNSQLITIVIKFCSSVCVCMCMLIGGAWWSKSTIIILIIQMQSVPVSVGHAHLQAGKHKEITTPFNTLWIIHNQSRLDSVKFTGSHMSQYHAADPYNLVRPGYTLLSEVIPLNIYVDVVHN
jgi:hypothetical protein